MTHPPIAPLGSEVVALYRDARAGTPIDFKLAALTRAGQSVPATSATWVNGVVVGGVPVMHDASSVGLLEGFWDSIGSLIARGLDPLGPAMFGAPGRSLVTLPDFYPPEFRAVIIDRYDIHCALTGLTLDPDTGSFSSVCFYRSQALPVFTEQERQWHEQLLPHWLDSLALHRVFRAAQEGARALRPGAHFAVVERSGLIHYAQPGFGEAVKTQWPAWTGARLPETLCRSLDNSGTWTGPVLRARWSATSTNGLKLVQIEHRGAPAVDIRAPAELAAGLEQAERQLVRMADANAAHHRDRVVAEERQRIVRELHDGVGAQLVGLLSVINRSTPDRREMEQAIQGALDELRLASDAMQTQDMSVDSALADLRYRLQPRLDAAGIQLCWDLAVELGSVEMAASEAFHLQRIFLEAFTNILKHAGARHVELRGEVVSASADHHDPWVHLELKDDGDGLRTDSGAPTGQGLRNMRYRADKLGAELTVESVAPTGTVVRLKWPIGRPPRA